MQTHLLHRYFMFSAYWSVTKRPHKLPKRLSTMNFRKPRNFQRVSWTYSNFPSSKILWSSVMGYITCSELALWTYFKAWKAWPLLSIMFKSFPHFYIYFLSKNFQRSNTNASLKSIKNMQELHVGGNWLLLLNPFHNSRANNHWGTWLA